MLLLSIKNFWLIGVYNIYLVRKSIIVIK